MDTDLADKLADIRSSCARIEGRMDELKEAQQRDIRAVHYRIDEVKADLSKSIKAAEKRASAVDKRPAAAAGGTVALVVGVLGEALRRIIGL